MKALKADAVIISSQKGFALHPGMSFIVITDKAYEDRCQKNSVQSLYFRLNDYAEDMRRGQTPYTPAVSVVNQLHSKLEKILREGIWAQIYHIESLASYFRGQLIEKTRFSIPQYPLSNCLTPVFCEKNNAMEIFEILKNRHDIYVTPCAGTTAPFLFRAAHMSRQLNEHDIDDLISALRNF
jgi:aspartate aminotransferase-like enzyme